MIPEYYKKYIDFSTKGRADIREIFENPKVFSNLIKDMIKLFKDIKFDKVIGIDALGFVLASPIALKLKKPLVFVRKEGKLPGLKKDKARISFIDYQKRKTMEILKKSINKNERVLIVDEWIETGGQVKAIIGLIESLGGKVAGIGVINADKKAKPLFDKYNLRSLI